ncbi:cat eye syndrome critical region protein 2 homolog [Stegodyphus dumicola]|uniref:cat eye syndrome critical region protein 2 homolog n=1 Tax=Stegodyphus dumicola TaxID=202533 RepID=UPI0015AAB238|nr:cat eye syndrome critical region protein 2 homolog [Stegodyphus dumicola]
MDEIQSWWEVPAVGHFCYIFRNVFKLLYFELAELEAAILNIQDPDMSISLEQLIRRLLQGCYEDCTIEDANWEQKLSELFEENFKDGENPLNGTPFSFLSPRSKVEILLKLCQLRLDVPDAAKEIKDIPPEDMQAKCVGKDSNNNVYWYFCDERLYKENLSPKKKADQTNNAKQKNKKTEKNDEKSWSIACHTSSDWEVLVKKLARSKNSADKELAKEIKETYLLMLPGVVSEKDRLLRKRFIELAPKRTSARISKVQAQKKLEEEMARKAAEEKRSKEEQQVPSSKKEAKEKQKAVEERAKRAELRQARYARRAELLENGFRSRRTKESNGHDELSESENECSDNSDESESEDNEHSNDDDNSSSVSESEKSDSDKSESESDSDQNETENHYSNSRGKICEKNILPPPQTNIRTSIFHNKVDSCAIKRNFVPNTYEMPQWKSTIDNKGHKLHILHGSFDDVSRSKRFRLNEAATDFRNGSLNDRQALSFRQNLATPSLPEQNFSTYRSVAPSPSVIRLDFVKTPPKRQFSS